MTTKILRLIQICVYLIITSQLLFYLIILSDALKQVSLDNFLELRKIVDALMSTRFRIIYYSALILTLTVVVLALKKPGSILFVTSAIALLCLIIDVTIAMKANVPINTMINQYTPGDITHDWNSLRFKWLNLINIRGYFIIVGVISQLVGLIWTTK
jgi:hypothetical protein